MPFTGILGQDRNIAVLARFFRGEPLEAVVAQEADGRVVLLPETANAFGTSPLIEAPYGILSVTVLSVSFTTPVTVGVRPFRLNEVIAFVLESPLLVKFQVVLSEIPP